MLLTAGRILVLLTKISLKKDLLYLKDTILQMLFNFVILCIQFLFFDFIYIHTPVLKVVSFKDAMFLLATQQLIEIFYYALFFKGFVSINELMISGKFDNFLLLPYYPALILNLYEIDLKELVGIFFPVFLFVRFKLLNSLNEFLLFFMLLLVGFGIRVFWGMLIRNLAIVFVNIISLQNLESSVFSYSAFPYFIYKGIWKIIFTLFIPIGLVANLSYAGVILSKRVLLEEGIIVLGILYLLSRVSFRLFLKKYNSGGG